MAHLQKDIAKSVVSAADLEQILQISAAQKGVSVLDVYSSEWGACKAISETFRRLFTEAGDGVHLRFFTVECNSVLEALRTEDPSIARHMRPKNTEAIKETLPEFWAPILEKRRGKSKPFFVMYKEGRKIYEVEGVNTPMIRAYVKDLCTVKTPASEFIQQQKLLEFWEENFNPEESEVSLEKFMRVMTNVCKLAVALTEEEKTTLFEAIGIKKETKEKIITAENLQKWIGEDEGKTVPQAFAETLPEYEVRAAQARAEREAEERKRQEQLRKEREEQERKEQEEREAEEAAVRKAEEEAVAASFKTYELPDRSSLENESPANAVARIDEETSAVMPQVKDHISRASAADDNAATWKFVQDTVADSANSLGQITVESVPFASIAEANEQANTILAELEKVSPLYFRAAAEQYNITPTRVACAALALSEKAGGVDAKASAIKCFARALAVSTAEDSAKLFGLDSSFVDFAESLQKGVSNFVAEQPSLAAYLLLSCADQVDPSTTFYAMLKPDEVPEAGNEVVIPALSVLSSAAPENVPENRVCIAVQGITRFIDLSAKNGQQIGACGWYYKGQISTSETASGFSTFVAPSDQEVMSEDKLKQLSKSWESESRIPEDTFLRAFHHLCLLRQLRREFAAKIDDPFWIKFNERLPHRPRDAVRELFNSMDGDGNGGLSTHEVVSGVSRALDIPYGDDITDSVEVAFAAVHGTRSGAGKSWGASDSSRVGVHELSLVIQCIRMYYEMLAKVSDRVLGSHSAKVLTPEDAQTSLALDLTEDDTAALFNEGNGKASFNEIASFAIKKNFDLAEDDDEAAGGNAAGDEGAAAAAEPDEEL